MATTTTLAVLRSRAKLRADMVNSNFITDAEWNLNITESHQKLHAMCVDALGENYYIDSEDSVTSGIPTIGLPTDFYKLYGVEMVIGNRTYSLEKMLTSERNLYKNTTLYSGLPPKYWLAGDVLLLYPTPPANMTVTVYYAPEANVLGVDSDQVKYPNGWEKFIVIDAAIQALIKEESSVTALSAERDRIVKEIESTKEMRDLAEPKRVREVDFEVDNSRLDWF